MDSVNTGSCSASWSARGINTAKCIYGSSPTRYPEEKRGGQISSRLPFFLALPAPFFFPPPRLRASPRLAAPSARGSFFFFLSAGLINETGQAEHYYLLYSARGALAWESSPFLSLDCLEEKRDEICARKLPPLILILALEVVIARVMASSRKSVTIIIII